MPVPDKAMLAILAMAQPRVSPGTAAGVNRAKTHRASLTRNWMGPQARLPKNITVTSVAAAYTAAIMPTRAM